jgi:hypothetical protein
MKHPETPLTRKLGAVRLALLRLHKTLLEAERVRYERDHGRIENGGALLQLVIHDPWFAWLRPLSGLVVEIDEELEGEQPMTEEAGAAAITQVRTMLDANDQGDVFQRNYHRALQDVPDVVIAHVEVTRILDAR